MHAQLVHVDANGPQGGQGIIHSTNPWSVSAYMACLLPAERLIFELAFSRASVSRENGPLMPIGMNWQDVVPPRSTMHMLPDEGSYACEYSCGFISTSYAAVAQVPLASIHVVCGCARR